MAEFALSMHGVALVLGVIGAGLALAAFFLWLADRSERRKWRTARRHLPFITE